MRSLIKQKPRPHFLFLISIAEREQPQNKPANSINFLPASKHVLATFAKNRTRRRTWEAVGGDRKPRRSIQLRGKIFGVTRDRRFSATRRRSSTSRFFFPGVEKAQGHGGETESQWTKRSSASPSPYHRPSPLQQNYPSRTLRVPLPHPPLPPY